MIILRDKETGQEIGTITEEQLQFLIDKLEEEGPDDNDYWISRDELETFVEQGADPGLVAILRTALGDREGFEAQWEMDESSADVTADTAGDTSG